MRWDFEGVIGAFCVTALLFIGACGFSQYKKELAQTPTGQRITVLDSAGREVRQYTNIRYVSYSASYVSFQDSSGNRIVLQNVPFVLEEKSVVAETPDVR